MTVKQLIAKLQEMPQNRRVILVTCSGATPNSSPLHSVDAGHYREESTWAGDVLHPDDVEEAKREAKECGQKYEAEPVVILWPVH